MLNSSQIEVEGKFVPIGAPAPRLGAVPIKTLFLTRYGYAGASSRQRCYIFADRFEGAGIIAEVSPLLRDRYVEALHRAGQRKLIVVFKSYVGRILALLRAGRYDVAWIEKEALPWLPAWLERACFALSRPIVVLDFDDAVYHAYGEHRYWLVRRLLGKKIERLMASATLVVAGNGYIADHARASGARWVVELPTVVDIAHYPSQPTTKPMSSTFTVGWIGSSLTSAYLEALRPAFAELANRVPLRILLIGAAPTALAGLPVERLPWSADSEAAALARCDVGIMPLPDAPWERGKCGYKIIQYMASWLPAVASPVGANRTIVVPGITGFLAENNAEWVEALFRLARDPELRRRMGSAGRQRAEEHYSLQVAAPRLIELLRRAAASA